MKSAKDLTTSNNNSNGLKTNDSAINNSKEDDRKKDDSNNDKSDGKKADGAVDEEHNSAESHGSGYDELENYVSEEDDNESGSAFINVI